jgi:hypothetical protein
MMVEFFAGFGIGELSKPVPPWLDTSKHHTPLSAHPSLAGEMAEHA